MIDSADFSDLVGDAAEWVTHPVDSLEDGFWAKLFNLLDLALGLLVGLAGAGFFFRVKVVDGPVDFQEFQRLSVFQLPFFLHCGAFPVLWVLEIRLLLCFQILINTYEVCVLLVGIFSCMER